MYQNDHERYDEKEHLSLKNSKFNLEIEELFRDKYKVSVLDELK